MKNSQKPIDQYRNLIYKIQLGKGLNEVTAKVIAYIYSEPKEIALDELAKKTKYSLATISNTIKFLEMHKAIYRVKLPGSKKVYVKQEPNLIKLFSEQLAKGLEVAVKPQLETIPKIIKEQQEYIKKEKNKNKKEELKEELKLLKRQDEQSKKIGAMFEKIKTILDEYI